MCDQHRLLVLEIDLGPRCISSQERRVHLFADRWKDASKAKGRDIETLLRVENRGSIAHVSFLRSCGVRTRSRKTVRRT